MPEPRIQERNLAEIQWTCYIQPTAIFCWHINSYRLPDICRHILYPTIRYPLAQNDWGYHVRRRTEVRHHHPTTWNIISDFKYWRWRKDLYTKIFETKPNSLDMYPCPLDHQHTGNWRAAWILNLAWFSSASSRTLRGLLDPTLPFSILFEKCLQILEKFDFENRG